MSAVFCRTVEPSDLQYLTDEDVEEIGVASCQSLGCAVLTGAFCAPAGGALTRVEKKRLQAAVQATRGAPLPLSPVPFVPFAST